MAGKVGRRKASLLFDKLDDSVDTAEIGREGFEQLCVLDARFEAYGKTLFAAGGGVDRDQQTQQANARLDAAVLGFCTLLADHFLTPPAFKALEHLVQRFRVHVHNVDALMHAALAYHATNEFVRLVQILSLQGGPFEFLAPMQASGAALPRAVLVQRCLTDRALLEFICQMAARVGEGAGGGTAVVLSFYAETLCEAVAGAKRVDEALVASLLPHVLAGLGPRASLDYQAATYMVVAQLASSTALSVELASALVTELCRSLTPALLPQAALLLAHLAATQRALGALPDRAFKHLAKLPGLAAALAELAERGPYAAPLLALVARATAARVSAHAHYTQLTLDLASQVPLGDEAPGLARAVLAAAASDAAQGSEEVMGLLAQAAAALEAQYPEAVDAAVSAALSDQQQPDASGKQAGKKKKKKKQKEQGGAAGVAEEGGQRRARVLSLLESAFACGLRAPLAEAGTTLALALDAASAGVRQMAVERVDELAAAAAEDGDGKGLALLHAAILRRLGDDAPAVVQAALQLNALAGVPPALLADALASCYAAGLAKAYDMSASKADRAAARGVARRALKLLTGPALAAHPNAAARALPLLLSALVDRSWPKLWATAYKAVRKLDSPLLAGLAEAQVPAPAEGAEAAAALSRAVVSVLACVAGASRDASTELQRLLLSAEGRENAAVLLVANAAMHREGGSALAAALLREMARGAWECAGGAAAAAAADAALSTEDGLPDARWLEAAGSRGADTGALRLAVARSALARASAEDLRGIGAQGLRELFARACGAGQPALVAELLARVDEVLPCPLFLSDWFAAPPEVVSAELVVECLDLYAAWISARASTGGGAVVAGAVPVLVLPRLLAALAHPARGARAAALRCSGALTVAGKKVWGKDCEPLLPAADCSVLLKALQKQRSAIESDYAAIERLLDGVLGDAGGAAEVSAAGLGLAAGPAGGLRRFLLHVLGDPGVAPLSPAGLHTLHFLAARIAAAACSPQEVLSSAVGGLGQFAFSTAGVAQPLQTELESQAAAELVALCSADRLLATLGEEGGGVARGALAALLAALRSVGVQGTGPPRLAALQQLSSAVYEAVEEAWREQLLLALLDVSGRDADDTCRTAAAALLRTLPLHASTLVSLLGGAAAGEPPASASSPAPRRRARQPKSPAAANATAAPAAAAEVAGAATAVLELVLERPDVQEPQLLVAPIQAQLRGLLDALAAAQEAEAGGEGAGRAPGLLLGSSLYLLHLVLSCLRALAGRLVGVAPGPAGASPAGAPRRRGRPAKQAAPEGLGAAAAMFDVSLAVRAAEAAPDAGTRDAALDLVACLAAAAPEGVLEHALAIVAVVGQSAPLRTAEQSSAAAARALAAVVPAWLGSGRSLEQLVGVVAGAAAGMPPHQRLPMLAALTGALPQESGLAAMLLVLLRRAAEEQATAEEQIASMAGAAGAGGDVPWPVTTALGLLHQALQEAQVRAGTALLQQCMGAASADPASASLPLLATGLVAAALQHAAAAPAARGPDAASVGAWSELMQQVLLQLQTLSAQLRAGRDTAAARLAKAGIETSARLLEELRDCMDPGAYVGCLGEVLASAGAGASTQRRALDLLAAIVSEATPQERAAMSAAALRAADATLGLARGAWERPAAGGDEEEDGPSLATAQAALAALGTLASAYGAEHPQHFVATVQPLLEGVRHKDAAVRSSTCATVAALARAVGTRLVPLLPALLPALLVAAQAAIAAAEAAAAGAGSESEGEEEAQKTATVPEVEALELAAALSALAALVDSLGAFLAPHVAELLAVLLSETVLECTTAHCAETAAHVRRRLAQTVPPRLMLPTLLGHVDSAVEGGAGSVCGLLDMLSVAMDAMGTPEVAALADSIFTALLRVLDLRRQQPSGWQGACLDRAEAAAEPAFVGLTLRLSESRFKPLLFRMVDWAQSPPGSDGTALSTSGVARGLGLFAVVNALAERLRGVFTPYLHLLVDLCLACLSGATATEGAGGKKKKKRRKSEAAGEAAGGTAVADAELLASPALWRLRLRVLRALHRAFLYDAPPGAEGRLLDEALFERLLPALAAQVAAAPAPGSAAELALGDEGAADGGPGAAAAGAGGEEGEAGALDAYGAAVVACLAQLAVTAGSDAAWKPLNHALLMATRALEPRARLVALAGLGALAARLAEEYLVLLPETLPFLAELLEDSEHAVEAAAAALLRRLEALSGESLEEYLKA